MKLMDEEIISIYKYRTSQINIESCMARIRANREDPALFPITSYLTCCAFFFLPLYRLLDRWIASSLLV